ncbi:MAG: hypothetical protein IKL97_01955 [Eggerthellaceae bacterium]|nr:hypothetical protein [Eggerthellaceae bacterium]
MAKNNEAKIVFNAATEQFDAAIQGSKAEIGRLNGELDKNSKALKNNNTDTNLLSSKIELLTQKEKEQSAVVENLRHKLEAAKFAYGENSNEVKELEGKLRKAEAQLMGLGDALDNAKAKLSFAESAYGQLTNEINRQSAEVKRLESEYKSAIIQFGKTSSEAKDLEASLSQARAELKSSKAAMGVAEDAARNLARAFDGASDEAKEMKSSIGELAAGTMLADFCTNAASSIAQLDEATQENRVNMSELQVAYEHSGRSIEEATDVYRNFLGIVGDEDQATEAALDMRNLADAGADVALWYDIASGAATAHGDALPIENLIESANETVRCGQVTGGLADALNWTTINQEQFNAKMSEYPGIMAAYNQAVSEGLSNEDAMNAALAKCGTEQERVALLTAALGTQYSEMGEQFQEANEAVAASRVASDELLQSQSKLADAATPLTTAVKALAADGIGFLSDHLNWIVPIAGIAAVSIGALALALSFGPMMTSLTASFTALKLAISGLAVPILPIIAVFATLAASILYLWNTNEDFRNAVTLAWEGIKTAITSVCEALAPIVQPAFEQIKSIVDSIMNGSIAPIISGALSVISGLFQTACGVIVAITTGDFTTLSNGVKSIFNGLKSIVSGIWSAIETSITSKIASARDFVGNAIDTIKGFFNFSWSLPHLKLPHVRISGSFSLMPPRTPSFSVSWYAKAMDNAMVLSSPTIFGYGNGSLLGAGEAGNEVVAGESHLMGLIGTVVQNAMQNDGTDRIVSAVEKLADRVTVLELNGRVLATSAADDIDSVSGTRQMLVGRGLTL